MMPSVISELPVLWSMCQDGRVLRWRRCDRGLEWAPMLRVPMGEGGEKGLEPLLGACQPTPAVEAVQVHVQGHGQWRGQRAGGGLRHFSSVLSMAPLPQDSLRYLVATEDGCVHTCSTNYLHQHVSVLAAHAGPVYRLSFR